MPRYLVEHSLSAGVRDGTGTARGPAADGDLEGVTWIHSYVSDDGRTSFSVYDAPGPEAIRTVARAHGLPVDCITEVQVLEPHLHAAESRPAGTGDEPGPESPR
jgi:hypothetical protein